MFLILYNLATIVFTRITFNNAHKRDGINNSLTFVTAISINQKLQIPRQTVKLQMSLVTV